MKKVLFIAVLDKLIACKNTAEKTMLLILTFLMMSTMITSAQKRNAKPSLTKEQIIQKLVSNMVLVEGGSYMMGCMTSNDNDASFDEEPVHEVTISDFYIGKYEVTQEEWIAVMGKSPLPDSRNHLRDSKSPAWWVSWDDCQLFVKQLSEITGRVFRLPTEAEWEFAAKGGNLSKGYKYAGSDNIDMVGWTNQIYNNNRPCRGGRLKPNELGLYDMSGNVGEWCEDAYGDFSYKRHSPKNPVVKSNSLLKVIRGGNHYDSPSEARVSKRNMFSQTDSMPDTGLRLVMER